MSNVDVARASYARTVLVKQQTEEPRPRPHPLTLDLKWTLGGAPVLHPRRQRIQHTVA